jgi:hypothetical protein
VEPDACPNAQAISQNCAEAPDGAVAARSVVLHVWRRGCDPVAAGTYGVSGKKLVEIIRGIATDEQT